MSRDTSDFLEDSKKFKDSFNSMIDHELKFIFSVVNEKAQKNFDFYLAFHTENEKDNDFMDVFMKGI